MELSIIQKYLKQHNIDHNIEQITNETKNLNIRKNIMQIYKLQYAMH